MLSYQHIYHAGNWADVHKHWVLAALLTHLKQKPKPMSYFETHAGRGFYDLAAPEAHKTGEAAHAILAPRTLSAIAKTPFGSVQDAARKRHGKNAYFGSPLIAANLLDTDDSVHLAELHPGEFDHLRNAMRVKGAHLYHKDGFSLVTSKLPPIPRRGLVLVDPSYEIKSDYADIPKHLRKWQRKWNVGLFALWYPILHSHAHQAMIQEIRSSFPAPLCHEVRFTPHKEGYGMIGSGFLLTKAPYGFDEALKPVTAFFEAL